MYVITVEFMVRTEHLGAFREAVLAQARNSLALEPDCHVFDVCSDSGEPRRTFLYEVYSDEAAFKAHLESRHFADFDATVRDWVASKEVAAWQRDESGAGS